MTITFTHNRCFQCNRSRPHKHESDIALPTPTVHKIDSLADAKKYFKSEVGIAQILAEQFKTTRGIILCIRYHSTRRGLTRELFGRAVVDILLRAHLKNKAYLFLEDTKAKPLMDFLMRINDLEFEQIASFKSDKNSPLQSL